MARTRKKTVYDAMIETSVKIGCAQIDVLNYYDPSNREQRIEELFVPIKNAYTNPSEKTIEDIEKILTGFNREIHEFRRADSGLETNPEIRKRLDELNL